MDPTLLSNWFPILRDAGFNVPRTEIVHTEADLYEVLVGCKPAGWDELLANIGAAGDHLGGRPFFLRTGHTAKRDQWKNSCFVDKDSHLQSHVCSLIERSAVKGWPCKEWVVRELLPVGPIVTLPAFRDFPLTQEIRGFCSNGEAECIHPYLSRGHIRIGFDGCQLPADFDLIVFKHYEINDEDKELVVETYQKLAEILKNFGPISIDLLKSNNKWYIIDVNEAKTSYHWEECLYAPRST